MASRRDLFRRSGAVLLASAAVSPGRAEARIVIDPGGRAVLDVMPEGWVNRITLGHTLRSKFRLDEYQVAEYQVRWGDGAEWLGETPFFAHVYTRPGTYEVRLTIRTPSGQRLAAKTVIRIHPEPEVSDPRPAWVSLCEAIAELPVSERTQTVLQSLGEQSKADLDTAHDGLAGLGLGLEVSVAEYLEAASTTLRAMEDVLEAGRQRKEIDDDAVLAFLYGPHLQAATSLSELRIFVASRFGPQGRRNGFGQICDSLVEEYLPYVLYYLEEGYSAEMIADLVLGTTGSGSVEGQILKFLIAAAETLIQRLKQEGIHGHERELRVRSALLQICAAIPG